MKNYKCKCGNEKDFFIEHNLSQCGLYCGECGKWQKWLNKDEERLFKHNNEKLSEIEICRKFATNLKAKMALRYGNADVKSQYVAMQINDYIDELLEEMEIEKDGK